MRNFLKNIFFALLIASIFFLSVEAVWRVRTAIVRKNTRFHFYGDTFLELKMKSILNRFYNWARQKDTEKMQYLAPVGGSRIILTFGGSTTQCTSVANPEDSWPNRMVGYLNERMGTSFTLVNRAQSGMLLLGNLETYKNYLISTPNTPLLVIFYMGINDALAIPQYENRSGSGQIKKIRVPFLKILDARLMRLSLLYASLKEKYCLVTKRDINKIWGVGTEMPQVHAYHITDKDIYKDLGLFKANLIKVITVSGDFNAPLLICSEPILPDYLKEHPEIAYTYSRIIKFMRDESEKKGVHFIDLNTDIFAAYKDFGRYYLDGIHIDEKGNELVAHYLADYIIEKNIISVKQ